MTRPTLDRTPPVVGSVWRERRRMYALRTASVVEVDPYWPSGFVFIRTVTNERGNPADQKTAKGRYRAPSRVSQSLWHEYWEPA